MVYVVKISNVKVRLSVILRAVLLNWDLGMCNQLVYFPNFDSINFVGQIDLTVAAYMSHIDPFFCFVSAAMCQDVAKEVYFACSRNSGVSIASDKRLCE